MWCVVCGVCCVCAGACNVHDQRFMLSRTKLDDLQEAKSCQDMWNVIQQVCVRVCVCVCVYTQSLYVRVNNIDTHTQYTHACTMHTHAHIYVRAYTHTHLCTHTGILCGDAVPFNSPAWENHGRHSYYTASKRCFFKPCINFVCIFVSIRNIHILINCVCMFVSILGIYIY